jgi:hypothetical protein
VVVGEVEEGLAVVEVVVVVVGEVEETEGVVILAAPSVTIAMTRFSGIRKRTNTSMIR